MNEAEIAAMMAGLNSDEVLEGYSAGRDGWPPNQGATGSWLHGWRNGRVDGGHTEKDSLQAQVARWYVSVGRVMRG